MVLTGGRRADIYNADADMRKPVVVSLFFHILVFVTASLSFSFFDIEHETAEEFVMSVDLMDISEIATTPVRDIPQESEKDEPSPPPPKKPVYNTASSVPDLVEPIEPELSEVPMPEVKKPEEPKIKPPPKPKNKPKRKPKPKPKSTPKVEEPPKDEPREENDDFDSMMRSLVNEPDMKRTDQNEDAPDSEGQNAQIADFAKQMTQSERDLLNNHIRKCWFLDIGVKNAQELKVKVRAHLTQDMRVSKVDVLEGAKNSYHQAAIDSARRALLNPVCNKLPIPSEKYEPTKVFIFDPEDMI